MEKSKKYVTTEVCVHYYTYFCLIVCRYLVCRVNLYSAGHVFTFMYISINIMINDKSSD